ncbi:ROK family protein [Nocardia sp. NPDC059246]|uniref:ROK family protein n=1 Tax=unclassified Nocardia TaxID=2637762 RepID=UPI0036C8A258
MNRGSSLAGRTAPTSARQTSLRAANLALVLTTVLRNPAGVSRASIASATGMTRATASRLVDELVAGGILAELPRAAAPSRGRPATPIIAASRLIALGLQVDTNRLTARAITLSGEIAGERSEIGDWRNSRPAACLARLGELSTELITALTDDVRIVGVGLALPGVVRADTATLMTAPNLGWPEVRPEEFIAAGARAGLSVRVGNEADLAARATAEYAPGRPGAVRDFFYVSGDTGIGGAAVIGGKVMAGPYGGSGEIGHVTVDPGGGACACGSTGCLELYAGRQALVAAAGLPTGTGIAELAAHAVAGNAAVLHSLERAAWALGIALAAAINILGIPVIVLGGHLAALADFLLPPLISHLHSRVVAARWIAPRVEVARPDTAPGATGAAYLALEELIHDPAGWIPERATDGTA